MLWMPELWTPEEGGLIVPGRAAG